jgi:hypothetical protein
VTLASARPRIIVVLGMHRSGTSVTTNLLNAFGVPLSDDLMPATEHNQKGYFESKEISAIHDQILAVMGMDWKTTSVDVPFPSNWWLSAPVQPLKEKLKAIARNELTENNGLWGFKDPRTARLLPVWLQIIDELELDAKFILCSRDPNEVAGSLYAREQIDPMLAELIWLEHNADAVTRLPGRIDAIVEYSKWIDDPIEQTRYMLERVGLEWKGSDAELERIVREVVSPDLRHQKSASGAFKLPFTALMYDALKRRDLAQLASLSEILNVSKGFAHVLLGHSTQRMRARIAQLETQLSTGLPFPQR